MANNNYNRRGQSDRRDSNQRADQFYPDDSRNSKNYGNQHNQNRNMRTGYGNRSNSNYGPLYGNRKNLEEENSDGYQQNEWSNSEMDEINREDWGRAHVNTDSTLNTPYDRGYYNEKVNSYPSQQNRGGNYNRYGGDTSNYGNANQGGFDRSWWNKTRDEVSSWFGDDDAERRRQIDKIHGPHRGKGPKTYTRSDDRIREDINDSLCDDSFIDASEIEVEVNHSDVILKGMVNSREEKRRAEDLTESVSGVQNVENHLHVTRNGKQDTRS